MRIVQSLVVPLVVPVAVIALLTGCGGPAAPSAAPSASPTSGTSGSPSPSGSDTASASASAPDSAAPTATPDAAGCTMDQLDIVYGPTDNTAGHAHGVLTFGNVSQQDCTLTGYSTVYFQNPTTSGPMGLPATHDPSEPTTPAVASVDGFSTADLTITDAGIVGGCTLVTAHALLVSPPGHSERVVVPIDPTDACANANIGLLSVSSNYIPDGS